MKKFVLSGAILAAIIFPIHMPAQACQEHADAMSALESGLSPQIPSQGAYVSPTLKGQNVSAAYINIDNPRTVDLTLTDIKLIGREGKAEMHSMVEEDGIYKMRKMDKFVVPSQGTLEMGRKTGDHIMLIGLDKPLETGEKVSLSLTFDDGSVMNIDVPVSAPQSMAENGHGDHHH